MPYEKTYLNILINRQSDLMANRIGFLDLNSETIQDDLKELKRISKKYNQLKSDLLLLSFNIRQNTY